MTFDNLTPENFMLVCMAILKMLTWLWPLAALFIVFCIFEHVRENRATVRVKPDSSEPW